MTCLVFSIATGSTISYAPGIFLVKGLQKLPGVNKWNADPATIEKRFGILGESMFIGLVLGAAIGLLAGYGIGDVIDIGIAMAAVMVLMPRMVKILMEGLLPISESAREWLNKRFGDREIYIGLDAAVALGHPSVISTALIFSAHYSRFSNHSSWQCAFAFWRFGYNSVYCCVYCWRCSRQYRPFSHRRNDYDCDFALSGHRCCPIIYANGNGRELYNAGRFGTNIQH
jgi:hypothetical protein